MGNLTDVVGGCTVENSVSKKYLLRKASVANPFGSFLLNEKVRVYSADFSEHYDGYVVDLPHDLGGGDWALGIYSTAISSMVNTVSQLHLNATTTTPETSNFQNFGIATNSRIYQTGNVGDNKYLSPDCILFTIVGANYELTTAEALFMAFLSDYSKSCSWTSTGIGAHLGGITIAGAPVETTTSDVEQTVAGTNTILAEFGAGVDYKICGVSSNTALYAAFTTPSGLSIGHYASDTADDDGGLVLKTYVDDALVSTNNVPANGVVRLPRVGCDGKQMYFKLANKGTVMDSFKLNSLTVEYQDGGDRH